MRAFVLLAVVSTVACRQRPVPTSSSYESPALSSVGKQLANQPVPSVPLARGGGPTIGTVSDEEARARVANARCKVSIACGREVDLDACATREAASLERLSSDCPLVDTVRLDACVSEITLGGCQSTAKAECDVAALCAR
jgi:hypothetical protein